MRAAALAAALFFASACSNTTMNNSPPTLWQLIEQLLDCLQWTLQTITSVVPVKWVETHNTHAFTSYESQGELFQLANLLKVKKIELRVNKKDGIGGILILDIVGACLTRQKVLEHYPDMQLRGPSPDFGADFSIQQAGGELWFGFKPNHCLQGIAIHR